MSNKIKAGKKKRQKRKKTSISLPEDVGKDKYFERHSYVAPDVKVTNVTYRGKI